MMAVTELAAELRMSPNAVKQRADLFGFPHRYGIVHDRRHRVLWTGEAAQLRAHFAGRLHVSEAADWLSAAQAARLLRLSEGALTDRVRTNRLPIRRRRTVGLNRGPWRYHPDDVRRAASALPVRPLTPPRGSYTPRQLAALAACDPATVRGWVRSGCPAGHLLMRGWYLRPAEVLAWLESQPLSPQHPIQATHRAALRAHVQQQRAA